MKFQRSFESNSLQDTQQVGQEIAELITVPSCIYLKAGMGAGKTTLTKSVIQALGYKGNVTSPTYNLIQEYPIDDGMVYHMDLYRLADPEEISFPAIEDLWSEKSIFLIEWPEKGDGFLLPASHEITIEKQQQSNSRLVDFIVC